jgi:hypothetical protein
MPRRWVRVSMRSCFPFERLWIRISTATCPFCNIVYGMAKEARTAPRRLTRSYVPGMGLLKKYLMEISRQVNSMITRSAADATMLNKELKPVTDFSKKDTFMAEISSFLGPEHRQFCRRCQAGRVTFRSTGKRWEESSQVTS